MAAEEEPTSPPQTENETLNEEEEPLACEEAEATTPLADPELTVRVGRSFTGLIRYRCSQLEEWNHPAISQMV